MRGIISVKFFPKILRFIVSVVKCMFHFFPATSAPNAMRYLLHRAGWSCCVTLLSEIHEKRALGLPYDDDGGGCG
jgi:hypothetical protein